MDPYKSPLSFVLLDNMEKNGQVFFLLESLPFFLKKLCFHQPVSS